MRCKYYGCTKLTSATIGNGIKSIEAHAFNGCLDLAYVSIGSNVDYIGPGAFKDCWSVMQFVSNAVVPPACVTDNLHGEHALYGIDKQNCALYVPDGSEPDYREADQWKEFYEIKTGTPSGIESVISNDQVDASQIYDLGGRKLDTLKKGHVNIIRMSNGTTKKVMVK